MFPNTEDPLNRVLGGFPLMSKFQTTKQRPKSVELDALDLLEAGRGDLRRHGKRGNGRSRLRVAGDGRLHLWGKHGNEFTGISPFIRVSESFSVDVGGLAVRLLI